MYICDVREILTPFYRVNLSYAAIRFREMSIICCEPVFRVEINICQTAKHCFQHRIASRDDS